MKKSQKHLIVSCLLFGMVSIGSVAAACVAPAPPPTAPTEPNLDHVTQIIDDETEFKEVFQSSTEGAIVEGYYLLGSDITLTQPWTNTATLVGTLDGGGYTISGLSLSASSGLFSALDNATVKDVSIVDAELGGEQSGVFAFKASKATFDNVYVSVASTVFGEFYETAPYKLVMSNQSQKSGLINEGDNAELTVKNCVIYMPEHLTKASGFICSYGSPKLTVTDSTFIGGNGAVVGARSDKTTAPTYTDGGKDYVICDAVKAYKDLYGNAICVNNKIMKSIPYDTTPANTNGWTDMQIAVYQENHPLKVFGPADFTQDNFKSLTSEIVVLKTSVQLLDTYLGVQSSKNDSKFSGVLDGQDNEISGIFTTTSQTGGIFTRLEGSVKNLALKGGVKGSAGLLTDMVQGTAYLENVYLEPTFAKIDSSATAIARRIYENTSLSMKDVVINIEEFGNARQGAITAFMLDKYRQGASGIYMDNCYCIAPEERAIGDRGDTDYLHSGTGNVEYFFWDIGDTVGGTAATEDDGLTWYKQEQLYMFNSNLDSGNIKLSDFLTMIIKML